MSLTKLNLLGQQNELTENKHQLFKDLSVVVALPQSPDMLNSRNASQSIDLIGGNL